MAERPADEAFAQHLLKVGLVTEEQVKAALRAQAERALRGEAVPLGEVLVQQGILTAAMRENLEKKFEAQREESKRLGPYRILKKLGEGGMGAVYLAEDPANGRKVALKVLPKVSAKEQAAVGRFMREVDSARKLDHPNIVRAGAAGEDKGYHFYVMEYVEGETLGDRLRREEALGPDEATKLVLQVAHGLKYAHGQGFIHRDIKPDNVMVTREGMAKILDMGLSKNIDEAQTFRTVTGVALGTPHYMAPEQARGDKGIDGRADIYALGATYYHLVTGETPFHGTTAVELIAQHINKQIPDPQDIRDGISDGVVHIIRRMMAKKPKDRYEDCAELLTDLELVAGGRNPSSQALDAAQSAVGLPMAREARDRYRAQRRKRTVRAATRSRSSSAGWVVGVGAALAIGIIVVLAVALSGGSEPVAPAGRVPLPVGGVTPPPLTSPVAAPAPKPADAGGRSAVAQAKLAEIQAAEKSGRFAPDEIRRRYAEFAREYADTTLGQTISEWLKSKEPKPEEPKVSEVPKPADPPLPTPSIPKDPEPALGAQKSLTQGLVGWWKMDEGSGTRVVDSSGRGHHGTIQGGATWSAGKIGKALSFDGRDGYVSIPSTPELQITDDLTIALWLNKHSIQSDFTRLVGKGTGASRNYGVWTRQSAKTLHVSQNDVADGSNRCFDGTTELEVGRWYHVTVVKKDGILSLFVDGRLDARHGGRVVKAAVTDDPLTLGYGFQHLYFHGLLDDVRIYNRALTEDETRDLFEVSREPGSVSASQPSKPSPPPTIRPSRISEGAFKFEGRSYKLFKDPTSWSEARSRCEALGGHLITISSDAENGIARNLAMSGGCSIWVGLTDDGHEGTWTWVTGEPMTYTKWLAGEPNNVGGIQNFAYMWHERDWQWDDAANTALAAFVCEWEPLAGRAMIPDAAKLREAEAAVRRSFKIDQAKTLDDKATLARTLLATASKSGAEGSELYALLRAARDLGAQGADPKTALEAIGRLSATFDVDGWAERIALFSRNLSKGADPGPWAELALQAAAEALEADEYESAMKLADRAESLAPAGDRWLQEESKERSRRYTEIKREADRLKEHFKTLEASPDDPVANGVVGKFMCLVREKWERGLPMLAKGADAAFKNLAEQELKNLEESAAQVSLADAWGVQAEREGPSARNRCRARAAEVLERAIPKLTGLARVDTEKKLASLRSAAGIKGLLALDLGGGVKLELVSISPGVFMSGGIEGNERPSQRVEITRPYYLGKYEVTCGQFSAFVRATGYKTEAERGGVAGGNAYNGNWGGVAGMDWRTPNFKPANASFIQTDDHPVTCVSWIDAKAFCDWAAKKNGRGVRLPTEAEWEYACRARTAAKWSWGDEESKAGDFAWAKPNTADHTHPVGQKKPNGFGLFDMHGNVWEWCADWWAASPGVGRDPEGPPSGDRRCIRGGSWWEAAVGCRSSFRSSEEPSNRLTRLGFRVAAR